jgi:protease-4
MFSRRHPFLFSIIILSGLATAAIIAVAMMISFKGSGTDFSGEKVGVVEIAGTISDARPIIDKLKLFRDQEAIKAIVVRIDSPGGAVAPSQEIYREIRKITQEKKVIASMGAIAASGGYYIAAGADGIVANPGTITGSIGVIMGYTNFQELLHKIGLVPVVIKSGQFKDMGSPAREMTAKERQILQNLIDRIHKQFVTAIAEGRNLDLSQVEPIADGRIFTAEEAIELGLVDRLGNIEDAIKWAGNLGGIKGKVSAVYAKEDKYSLLRYLFEATLETLLSRTTHPTITAEYLYRPNSGQ